MAQVAARIVARRDARCAELALAIGAFAIGTGEFAAMGFLPSVADGLGVTIPEAGRSAGADKALGLEGLDIGLAEAFRLGVEQPSPGSTDRVRLQGLFQRVRLQEN